MEIGFLNKPMANHIKLKLNKTFDENGSLPSNKSEEGTKDESSVTKVSYYKCSLAISIVNERGFLLQH